MHESAVPSQSAFLRLLLELLDLGEDATATLRPRILCEACRLLDADALYTVMPEGGAWVKTGFGPQRELGSLTASHASGVARHVLSKRTRFLEARLPVRGPFHRHQDGWTGIEVSSYIAVPIHRRGRTRGVLVLLRSAEKPPFGVDDLGRADLLADALAVSEDVIERIAGLEDLARTDGLTRLPNQRQMRETLTRSILRAGETDQSLTLLVAEADLQTVSKLRGAIASSDVLPRIARVLERNLRGTDVVGHHGGGTFVILLPETTKEEAACVKDRLERAILPERIAPGIDRPIPLHWGVASYPEDGSDASSLLAKAGMNVISSPCPPVRPRSEGREMDDDALQERSA